MYQDTLPDLIPLTPEPCIFAKDPQFNELLESPAIHEKPFSLSKGMWMSFDGNAGGLVTLSATRPAVGMPFLSITPREMGASNWLSIETAFDLAALKNLEQIVPILEAGAARSVSLFAAARFVIAGEQVYDTSSIQIDLRKDRCTNSFPISLADLPKGVTENAVSARLILFIEARDVTIDLYSLSVFGLSKQPDCEFSPTVLARLRNDALEEERPHLHYAGFDGAALQEAAEIPHHRVLENSFHVDIEAMPGCAVQLTPGESCGQFDFSKASACAWRTLEMRFDRVENTGSVNAVISLEGAAEGVDGIQPLGLMFRWYDTQSRKFEDKGFFATLDVGPLRATHQAHLDISALLPDSQSHHDFGIFCFVPENCTSLKITRLETFVYDKRY